MEIFLILPKYQLQTFLEPPHLKGDQGPDQLEIPFLHAYTFGSDGSWIKSSFKHTPCRVNCQTQRELEAG